MGMSVSKRRLITVVFQCATVLAGFFLVSAEPLTAEQPGALEGAGQWGQSSGGVAPACLTASLGSPYISVDSWVYPAVLRLYAMGFVDDVYLGMRPWTRAAVSHMVETAGARIEDADAGSATDEAQDIYEALMHELRTDTEGPCLAHQGHSRVESVYTVARGISGTPLRDSFHLGSTIVNDYGRPYQNGFNNYSGASGYASAGRFVLYARGEFEAAPSAAGYSAALAQELSTIDETTFLNASTGLPYNQATIPMGPISSATQGRFIEAYLSAHLIGHEISFGKQDDWLGPGLGGGMAYSNNAEDIYSFRINRAEPLHVPLLSRIFGPFRYEFLVGELRGHTLMPYVPTVPPTSLHANVTNPGNPWVHIEKVSLRPTENLEFGFERTVIWGGKGHGPITLHSFLKSFFSISNVSAAEKFGRDDPGARFGAFDFSYRLPFVRNWLTLYTDSEVHDDYSPIDAPRRAAMRPGLYLSHVPGIPKLDLRVEAATTDTVASTVSARRGGHFMYWETIQRQGYTNQGQLFGDWIGREDKGGQGWLTYHLSGNEWLQVGVRNQKAVKDFIAVGNTLYGTTLNDINFQAVKRIGKNFEVNGAFTYEHWKAPIYLPGQQTVTSTTIQLTWFPERKVSF
jgi:hypothetical protein